VIRSSGEYRRRETAQYALPRYCALRLVPVCYARRAAHCLGGSWGLAKGTVKFFYASKGYGIITPHDGSKDVFVHLKDVERSGLTGLHHDQVVEFERETDKRSGNIAATRLKLA
jgi:cold shock protein